MATTKKNISVIEIRFPDEALDQCREVLKSGMLREGKYVSAFEKAVADYTGARHAIACSSGTAALHLAYLALLKPGDEVLTTPFTFISTSSMITMAGARPVFCDIDQDTLLLDATQLKKKLTSKTRAIAPVHLYGNACDIESINDFSRENKLSIIWDAAQSLGTRYKNKDIGAYPDIACFSFYPTKNIATGEGGMITTNSDELAAQIRLLKAHGESDRYHHEVIGLNYRMTEISAVLGVSQMKSLPDFLKRRQQIASRYKKLLGTSEHLHLITETPDSDHSYNYFSICLNLKNLKISRDDFVKGLASEGIHCGIHYPKPLHKQPCFIRMNGEESFPNAEEAAASVLALPMHPYLSDDDIDYTCDKVLTLLKAVAS